MILVYIAAGLLAWLLLAAALAAYVALVFKTDRLLHHIDARLDSCEQDTEAVAVGLANHLNERAS